MDLRGGPKPPGTRPEETYLAVNSLGNLKQLTSHCWDSQVYKTVPKSEEICMFHSFNSFISAGQKSTLELPPARLSAPLQVIAENSETMMRLVEMEALQAP